MALEDWRLVESDLGDAAPQRDWIIEQDEALTLGDTTLRFDITPGHTPGVVSIEFPRLRPGPAPHGLSAWRLRPQDRRSGAITGIHRWVRAGQGDSRYRGQHLQPSVRRRLLRPRRSTCGARPGRSAPVRTTRGLLRMGGRTHSHDRRTDRRITAVGPVLGGASLDAGTAKLPILCRKGVYRGLRTFRSEMADRGD